MGGGASSESRSKLGDYHRNMRWINERLIPSLDQQNVLVTDDAAPYNVLV